MKADRSFKQNGDLFNRVIDFIAIKRWIIPLGLTAIYAIVYSILFPKVFLSAYNLSSVLLEVAVPAFIIIGMSVQLINGEIDLSVGYAIMFSNVICATLMTMGVSVPLAILLTILATASVGAIVGFLVAKIGINSFIATLGSGMVFNGLGLMIYNYGNTYPSTHPGVGVTFKMLPESYLNLGQYKLLGLQLPVIFALIAIIAAVLLMSRSRACRNFYYTGMNRDAAKLSGINVPFTKFIGFIISSTLAAVAGILLAARMGGCASTLGIGWELKAITAAVIGGVSFKGGRGTMLGAICGGVFFYCIQNGLRIANAPSNLYTVIEGVILLLAVILDAQFSKRKVIG